MRTLIFLGLFAVIAIAVASCDIYAPQTKYTIAVSKDSYYVTMVAHLKTFLEANGYEITLITTDKAVEANRLVAEGKADLTFANNVSSYMIESLGPQTERLQTILPLTSRVLMAFSRKPLPNPASARDIFEGKTLGVEVLNGESHNIIQDMLDNAKVNYAGMVQYDNAEFDVRVFWGSPYGRRSSIMLDSGWHSISFDESWIEFQTLTEPAIGRAVLPAQPGDPNSTGVNTLMTDAVLVGSSDLGENAVYKLAATLLEKRLALVREDPMYRSISEVFDRETLLYPLHTGTASYIRRDTPTFFERYADSLALILSAIVLLYSVVKAVQARMRRVRKDKIDEYFLEFLEIRSKHLSVEESVSRLDDLFQRAVVQMTNEKMEKDDFHIFSRLVQQEVTIHRLNRQ
jgi:TRAP-type uncharacterized transport system substrate-binding protein